MNVLVIEDEIQTAKRLVRMLKEIDAEFNVVEIIETVEESVKWLNENSEPDLIFMDIQLSDGQCFEIFNQIDLTIPVIFTTSYNEYAIKAFEVNSVDYLLKPIEPDALEKSINKFKRLHSQLAAPNDGFQEFLNQFRQENKQYKNRFLVKTHNSMIYIPVENIAFCYIENQLTFLHTFEGKRYMVNYTIEMLSNMLSPKYFFRIHRHFIIHIESIKTIHNYFNATLKLDVVPNIDKEIIVSRYQVKDFKEWLDL